MFGRAMILRTIMRALPPPLRVPVFIGVALIGLLRKRGRRDAGGEGRRP